MKKYSKQIFYLLMVFWCMVIFYLSSQTSSESSCNSLAVLKTVSDGIVSKGLHSMFRTFMHAGVFTVLGILVYMSIRYDTNHVFLFSLLFCVLYAISDEVHQIFVPRRAFELEDLAYDFLGSFVGILSLKIIEIRVTARTKLIEVEEST